MTYPGGKNGAGVYQSIINQMPPHKVYIEAFLGGGAVLRAKKPAIESIAIDADEDVVTTFPSDAVPNLTIFQGDAIEWLAHPRTSITNDALVYLDPPYLMETRSSHRRIYRYELTHADHARLLRVIKQLQCMVIISGYWSAMYEEALQGWRVETFQTTNRAGQPTAELLWLNFPKPLELHDYRYLGTNFRERERIKRKKARWIKRLQGMDQLEKYALMEVIEQLRSG